jgi:tRNA (guanine-N7-)-methyltransferase
LRSGKETILPEAWTESRVSLPWPVVPWQHLDWPLDWTACFGREAPLHAELGFGDGEFLEHRAAAAPLENWIGVEVSWSSVRRMLRRLERRRVTNVRLVQGDAAWILERLFPTASLDEIVVNHSDPWPKKRHLERRLVQPRFLSVVASRLRMGGRATLVTDHADYADWIARGLTGTPGLSSVFSTERVHALPDRPPTRYERKGRAAGSRIHYFVWEKVEDACPMPAREMRCEVMPNVLLEGTVSWGTLFQGAFGRPDADWVNAEGLRIQVLGVYEREDRREWLIEIRVDEEGFVQHLALSVTLRPGSRLLIKPSTIGFPRPTPGVREAVNRLSRELLHRNPGLRILASGVGNLL